MKAFSVSLIALAKLSGRTCTYWEVKLSLKLMIPFSSARSNFLVMAKICPSERSVGLFKCCKKRLEVYKSVNEIENFTSSVTRKAYKVNHSWNCDDRCWIHLLACQKCFKPGPNLDLLCVQQSDATPFCENYRKFFFFLMQTLWTQIE